MKFTERGRAKQLFLKLSDQLIGLIEATPKIKLVADLRIRNMNQ